MVAGARGVPHSERRCPGVGWLRFTFLGPSSMTSRRGLADLTPGDHWSDSSYGPLLPDLQRLHRLSPRSAHHHWTCAIFTFPVSFNAVPVPICSCSLKPHNADGKFSRHADLDTISPPETRSGMNIRYHISPCNTASPRSFSIHLNLMLAPTRHIHEAVISLAAAMHWLDGVRPRTVAAHLSLSR